QVLARLGDVCDGGGLFLDDGADLLRRRGVLLGAGEHAVELAGEGGHVAALDALTTLWVLATPSRTAVKRSAVRSAAAPMSRVSLWMPARARSVSLASFFTSPATMAKPRPCSPA